MLRSDTTLHRTVTCATKHCPGPSTLLEGESVPTSANVSCLCRVRRTCSLMHVSSACRLPSQVPQGTCGSRRVSHAALCGRYGACSCARVLYILLSSSSMSPASIPQTLPFSALLPIYPLLPPPPPPPSSSSSSLLLLSLSSLR